MVPSSSGASDAGSAFAKTSAAMRAASALSRSASSGSRGDSASRLRFTFLGFGSSSGSAGSSVPCAEHDDHEQGVVNHAGLIAEQSRGVRQMVSSELYLEMHAMHLAGDRHAAYR